MTLKFHPSTLTGHILTALEFYLPGKNIFEVIQNLIMGGGGGDFNPPHTDFYRVN